ncbi:poly-gamma-glutamate hydrolase family protein [Desulfolucanica intricata]|uniref:poly-gamma-glutamate hydrolase family protein n=1 Tax=Desulfolucanica intricata TaxID=1285191 RepID=UPI0008297AA9|nr:poly-gamma-glutamate hydrolase family protein [Desulfolucanica intricata]
MSDRYGSFRELQAHEQENVDYRIKVRDSKYPVLIMAPHGGKIEPYTADIAEWIAGDDFALYIFECIKSTNSRDLHITSHNFDEPRALAAADRADIVLTIHGLRNRTEEFIMVGGLDEELGNELKTALKEAGLTVREPTAKYRGRRQTNICNRGRRGKGIQLEITFALRKHLFEDLHLKQRFTRTVRSFLWDSI